MTRDMGPGLHDHSGRGHGGGVLDPVEFVNLKRTQVHYGADGENTKFAASMQGIRDAFSTISAGEGAVVYVPPGSFALVTTGLTVPEGAGLIGPGHKQAQFSANDGIGTAIRHDGSNWLQGFRVVGDSAGSADDAGLRADPSGSFSVIIGVETQRFWKNCHVDGSFNNYYSGCNFDFQRTGTSQGAAMHVDPTNGNAADNRFIACQFGQHEGRGAWIEEGKTKLVAPSFESGTGDHDILVQFGSNQTIVNPTIDVTETTTPIRVEAGTQGTITGGVVNGDPTNGPGHAVHVPGSADEDSWAIEINHIAGSVTDELAGGIVEGNTMNGMGQESANAETPTASKWSIGDVVDFTDSGDGSGTGVYLLLHDRTWKQL